MLYKASNHTNKQAVKTKEESTLDIIGASVTAMVIGLGLWVRSDVLIHS